MIPKDIITTKDFSRDDINFILERAEAIKNGDLRFTLRRFGRSVKTWFLGPELVASLFFEPSTRTNQSFSAAIQNLGCSEIGFSDPSATSYAGKGESLNHTLKMFEGYGAEAIVMRHPWAGAARYASEVVDVPIVNGGDGSHQHPTQSLLDLLTIHEEFGRVDGLNIGFLGDHRHGRTTSSLSEALANYEVRLYFIAPEPLQITHRPEVLLYLKQKGTPFKITEDLEDTLPDLHVLYATRIQTERIKDPDLLKRVEGSYTITNDSLQGADEDMILMHPLPIVDEFSPEVDENPHARYFQQAQNGLPIRTAILDSLLKGEYRDGSYDRFYAEIIEGEYECQNSDCIAHENNPERQRGFITPRFGVLENPEGLEGTLLQCVYCDSLLTEFNEPYQIA